MVCGAGDLDIVKICVLLTIMSILGDQCGYFLGRRTGPRIFSRPDSRFFKQRYVQQTQAFYEKHGGKTLFYAKFVPIVRTFAPFMAGVGRMNYTRFLSFNISEGSPGCYPPRLPDINWVHIRLLRHNFEKVAIGIAVISVLPMVIQYFRTRNESA